MFSLLDESIAVISNTVNWLTSLYGDFDLRRGDSDSKQTYAGHRRDKKSDHVSFLQSHLCKLGIPVRDKLGEFGPGTEFALKLFQWNAKNLSQRLKGNTIVTVEPIYNGAVNGVATQETRREILRWLGNGHICTGDLIRLRPTILSNVTLSSDFKRLNHPYVLAGEFVISRAIRASVLELNRLAKDNNVVVRLNQTLRVLGTSPKGAVVTPAKKSQHYIGHAIDCNILDGRSFNTSSDFKSSKQTKNAISFIEDAKRSGLRWGGDFRPVDTPHFDKNVSASSFDYDAKHYFNQAMISGLTMIPLVI